MSVLFTPGVNGSPADVTAYNANWDLLEGSFADRGTYLISGLAVSIGTGLSVNVALGVASIGGRVTVAAPLAIAGLTPSVTNDLYLQQNGTGTALVNPSTQPALSVKLGTCVTGVATVTSVSQTRSSGCQQQVRTENLVLGGPGGGQPASLNLASWAAAAADGVPCFGVLPSGAVPAPSTAFTTLLSDTVTDAGTTLPTSFLLLTHPSSATPAAGFGTAIEFAGDDSAHVNRRMGKLQLVWQVATSGSTVSRLELLAANGGSYVTCLTADGTQLVTIPGSWSHTGLPASNTIGFWGATPAVQPLGSADVLGSLVTLGLRAASSNPPLNLGTGHVTAGQVNINPTSGTIALPITAASGQTAQLIYTQSNLGAIFFVVDAVGQLFLGDGSNLALGTTTGTKIGTTTSQKVGFFGTTAVVQQANASQATITSVTDANAKAALQSIYNALKNLGLCAATA